MNTQTELLLNSQGKDKFVLSPYSLNQAFNIFATLVDDATYAQFKSVLNLPSRSELIASVKSSLIKSDAIQIVNFIVENVDKVKDFELKSMVDVVKHKNIPTTINYVNSRVKQITNGQITKLVGEDEVDLELIFLLVNAIHFKSNWKTKFDPSCTRNDVFYNSSKSNPMVPFMNAEGVNAKYGGGEQFRALQLPYEHAGFSMLFIKTDNKLAHSFLNQVRNSLIAQDVDVKIPKFKHTYKTNMASKYEKMGLDLSGLKVPYLADTLPVDVVDIIHQAVVEVDEIGTIASAATVISCRSFGIDSHNTPHFVANTPFYYLIMKNETILFVGYFDP